MPHLALAFIGENAYCLRMKDHQASNAETIAHLRRCMWDLESDWHHKLLPCGSRYPSTVSEMTEAYPGIEDFYEVASMVSEHTGEAAVMVKFRANTA
jgi:hypothetical protein